MRPSLEASPRTTETSTATIGPPPRALPQRGPSRVERLRAELGGVAVSYTEHRHWRGHSFASQLIWHPIQTPCGALRATRAARDIQHEVSTEGKYGGQKCSASPRLRLGDHLCIRVEARAAADLVSERSRHLQAIKKRLRPAARSETNVVVLNFQFAIWGGVWRLLLFSGGERAAAASFRPVRAHLITPTFGWSSIFIRAP